MVNGNRIVAKPSYAFDIETLLSESQARSLLLVGKDTEELLRDYLAQKDFLHQNCALTVITDDFLERMQELGRFDVAVVAGALETLSREDGAQLIARLRDLHTPRFCVVLSPPGTGEPAVWQSNDFFGLGLRLVNSYEDGTRLFKYDIATYKKTPDWFNADGWANPELWDKYRW